MMLDEYRVDITRERATGRVLCVIHGVEEDGQLRWIADEDFGPFDTALDVVQFAVRHIAPRLRLPLR